MSKTDIFNKPNPHDTPNQIFIRVPQTSFLPHHRTSNTRNCISQKTCHHEVDISYPCRQHSKNQHEPVRNKPNFLKAMENFLKKELKKLNATDEKPSELRLQAHSQVFETMIENFRTFRPLLAAIKNEYEMMITHNKMKIRELEPLKEAMYMLKERFRKQVMDFKEEQRKEIANLKKENRKQLNELSVLMTEKLDLKKQVQRLQAKLKEEYYKYRDELDSRKLLISEITSLRFMPDYLF